MHALTCFNIATTLADWAKRLPEEFCIQMATDVVLVSDIDILNKSLIVSLSQRFLHLNILIVKIFNVVAVSFSEILLQGLW